MFLTDDRDEYLNRVEVNIIRSLVRQLKFASKGSLSFSLSRRRRSHDKSYEIAEYVKSSHFYTSLMRSCRSGIRSKQYSTNHSVCSYYIEFDFLSDLSSTCELLQVVSAPLGAHRAVDLKLSRKDYSKTTKSHRTWIRKFVTLQIFLCYHILVYIHLLQHVFTFKLHLMITLLVIFRNQLLKFIAHSAFNSRIAQESIYSCRTSVSLSLYK